MKIFFLFSIILIMNSCNKPKTVLICGDHICINKAEAEQYFEDNLTLEVKIIDKKSKKNNDLVELNLNSNNDEQREISVINKKKTKKKLKILSNEEIEKKKAELKIKKKKKNKQIKKVVKLKNNNKDTNKLIKKVKKNEIKFDNICTILNKCNIDEISEYLVKQGKKKNFPDITIRDN